MVLNFKSDYFQLFNFKYNIIMNFIYKIFYIFVLDINIKNKINYYENRKKIIRKIWNL